MQAKTTHNARCAVSVSSTVVMMANFGFCGNFWILWQILDFMHAGVRIVKLVKEDLRLLIGRSTRLCGLTPTRPRQTSDPVLLICGRSTRLCGLPPTRPRQTSDPVLLICGRSTRLCVVCHLPVRDRRLIRETPTARFIFPSHLRHSIERQTHMLQAGRFFRAVIEMSL